MIYQSYMTVICDDTGMQVPHHGQIWVFMCNRSIPDMGPHLQLFFGERVDTSLQWDRNLKIAPETHSTTNVTAITYLFSTSSWSSRCPTLLSRAAMVALVLVRIVFSNSVNFSFNSLFCLSSDVRCPSNFCVTERSELNSPETVSSCKQMVEMSFIMSATRPKSTKIGDFSAQGWNLPKMHMPTC